MTYLVRVVPYQEQWPVQYLQERAELARILGASLITAYHIGSTSVPGLWAKPIIDILPVVRELAALEAKGSELAELGYEDMGEYGIPGRRFLRKGGTLRTHHLHCFTPQSLGEIERHVAFRDYLRQSPRAQEEYAQLKLGLAQQFPEDIEGYCAGKDSWIKATEQQAIHWRRQRYGALVLEQL